MSTRNLFSEILFGIQAPTVSLTGSNVNVTTPIASNFKLNGSSIARISDIVVPSPLVHGVTTSWDPVVNGGFDLATSTWENKPSPIQFDLYRTDKMVSMKIPWFIFHTLDSGNTGYDIQMFVTFPSGFYPEYYGGSNEWPTPVPAYWNTYDIVGAYVTVQSYGVGNANGVVGLRTPNVPPPDVRKEILYPNYAGISRDVWVTYHAQ